jgi:hypothetical protein
MNNSHDANLPPELDSIGARLQAARPVASEQALGRAMTRASQKRTRKASSLLWMSRPPAVPDGAKLGVGAAAAAISLGSLGGTALMASTAAAAPSTVTPVCPPGTILVIQLGGLGICVRL